MLRPESLGVEGAIAQTLLASGEVQQARQLCESPSTKIDESDRHQCLALAYHFLGRQTEAQQELAKYQVLEGDSAAYSYAGIYSQWGDVAMRFIGSPRPKSAVILCCGYCGLTVN